MTASAPEETPSAPAYTYVASDASLAKVTEALRGVRRVGLDTEADSLHHYFEKVCLIQLSFSDRHFIVDPLAGLSLEDFLKELAQKELIIQGADYDLRMMKRSFGFRPKAPVFDTMLAAQVLGYEKIGLAALAERICGVALSKSGQKSDWSKRPLSEKQLRYAADDTRYLEKITDVMTAELRSLGRENWHRQCCARVVESAGLSEETEDPEAWRIKGSSKLQPRALAFLKEIWKWRDEEARRRDRPPFMILLNEDLVALAEWQAVRTHAVLTPEPKCLKRITGELLAKLHAAIKAAESLSPSQWPMPPERSSRPQGAGFSPEKVEAALAGCRAIATMLKIEPCFLASRAAVTAIVRNRAHSVEQICEVSGMTRWQAEQVLPAVQKVL